MKGTLITTLGLTALVFCNTSIAQSYVGVGSFKSEFAGSEFDRKYESDENEIRQINFGYNNKEAVEIFGGVNLDENDEVRDFALGIALKDKVIRIEQGKISGLIVDDDGPIIGTFDNEYKRFDILGRSVDGQGFQLGLGVQEYAVPHLFEFNDGSEFQGPMLQDDALSFTTVGFGAYYDSIYNYLMHGNTGFHNDWYFSTSTLAISIAYVENSDSPDLVARDMNGQSWLMWGNSGTYELGWVWGYKSHFLSVAANIGYHIRANTFFNLDPSEAFAMEPDEGDILLDTAQTILHGPVAALSVSF